VQRSVAAMCGYGAARFATTVLTRTAIEQDAAKRQRLRLHSAEGGLWLPNGNIHGLFCAGNDRHAEGVDLCECSGGRVREHRVPTGLGWFPAIRGAEVPDAVWTITGRMRAIGRDARHRGGRSLPTVDDLRSQRGHTPVGLRSMWRLYDDYDRAHHGPATWRNCLAWRHDDAWTNPITWTASFVNCVRSRSRVRRSTPPRCGKSEGHRLGRCPRRASSADDGCGRCVAPDVA
jgi:hypothetical protein